MFYMASQIVFFLFLATLVGVGIGWGLSSASKVSVFKALSRSGADAPRERELTTAKSQIEELSRQLSIAKEAIREIETKDAMVAAAAAVAAEHDEQDDAAAEDSEEATDANGQGELVEFEAGDDASETAAEESPEGITDDLDEETVTASPRRMSRDKGGRRLSERVADATVGAPESTD